MSFTGKSVNCKFMERIRNIGTLDTVGGNLCCDFINTVYAWRGENLHEYFGSYNDFIAWCRKLRVSDNNYLDILEKVSGQDISKTGVALKRIKEIRALLYRFIAAIAAQEKDEITLLLPQVNTLLANSLSHINFRLEYNRFILDYEKEPVDLLSPLWQVLQSLYVLLDKADLTRVKECPRCGWVFLDQTKNGKRRWCDPAECGTADKMKRYYIRKKEDKDQDN